MALLQAREGHDAIRRKVVAAVGSPPDDETPEAVRRWAEGAAAGLAPSGRRLGACPSWREHGGIECIAAAPPEPVIRPAPIWIGAPDPRFPAPAQRGAGTPATTAGLSILRIRDGSVAQFGRFGVLVGTADTPLVSDLSCPEAALAELMDWDLGKLRSTSYRHLGSALYLTDRFWSANYAHWMLDALARLCLAGDREEGLVVATTPIRARWQIDLLTAAGVREQDVLEIGEYEGFVARDLLVADDVGGRVAHPAARAHPRLVGAIRRRCGAPLLPKRGGPVVLVSRRNSGSRLIEDEATFVEQLRACGVVAEVVELEEHTPAEQWRIFGEARAIVAVHGAALANTVVMRPGATLVEILPPAYAIPGFWLVAGAVGVRHVGVTAVEEAADERLPRRRNIRVPARTAEAIADILTE
ncbi:hypothetical protein STAQ_18050 [Allostella sp. ATCC 35155]|nr:hypothetical protein STAQ_18050 [Stella sp. ATCC 35155]